MGQRHSLAIHLPGQQRIFHGRQGHRAFHNHALGIDTCWQHFAARAGHVNHAICHAPQCLDHVTHGHATPDHTTRCPHSPRRTAGLAGEECTTIAGALQHHGDGLQPHGLELTHRQRLGLFDAFNLHSPAIAVCHDGFGWRGQVVAHIKLVGGRDHAGAKRAALGLDGGGAVHDHSVRILEARIAGQRLGRRGCGLCQRLRLEAGQTGCSQGAGTASKQTATRQRCGGVLHEVSSLW